MLSVFCVIFIVSYSIILDRSAVDNEVSGSEFAMTSISKNIRLCLDSYKQMSRQIMLNSDVTAFLCDNPIPLVYEKTKARDGIISVLNTYSFVDSVYVFHLNGESVRTGAGIMNVNYDIVSSPEWNEPLIEARGASIVMIDGNGAFLKDTGTHLITMTRLIYDMNTQKVIGKLVVNLMPSVLYSSLKDLGRDRAVCFFDRDGNILWGDESLESSFKPEFVGGGFIWEHVTGGGKNQILSAYSTQDLPIVQVSLSDVSASGIQSWETIWLAITLLAAVVLAVFSSGTFISINIARPIDMLTEAIDNTKSNGMLHEIHLSLPNNEIRRLADSYNSMVVHINQLITELIEKEKSIQKAEMRTLHEQIKPHFLYNSLETISYMAMQGGAPKVHDALETLGSFYRNFLSKGSRDIPLRNEILIVRDYLALQKLRYGDAFDDEYDLDENVLDTMIPKLILQPLVENSLYHGVRLKGEKGIIRIGAFEEGGAVHITVYDTGVGMTQEQIDMVLSGSADDEDLGLGFGLKGTIERIRYYCNYHEVTKIRSVPGEYTEIELIIPKQKQETLIE